MGYTHYFTQTRSFSEDEWVEVSDNVQEILSYVENLLGVPLANGQGRKKTRPQFTKTSIMFNGLGDDSHETFIIHRNKQAENWDFCKTARNPYDVAVTACLCYLSSVLETHHVTSDGKGQNFLIGLDAARKAIPEKANMLDLPMGVMQNDRWTGPWIRGQEGSGYSVDFCIDKNAYVTHIKSGQVYCAPREELAQFLEANKTATFRSGGSNGFGSYGQQEPNIWSATGSFDQSRHTRIAKAQAKVLAQLFPVDAQHSKAPPAYVRPNIMLKTEDEETFHYSLSDLISSLTTTKQAA